MNENARFDIEAAISAICYENASLLSAASLVAQRHGVDVMEVSAELRTGVDAEIVRYPKYTEEVAARRSRGAL